MFALTAFVLINANYVEGARILGIFPLTAKSHFQCNEAVMSSLVAAGHDVTLITAFPNLVSGKNYTIIDSSQDNFIYIGQTTWHHFVKTSTYELDVAASGVEKPLCKKVLELKEVQVSINYFAKSIILNLLKKFRTVRGKWCVAKFVNFSPKWKFLNFLPKSRGFKLSANYN